MAEPVASGSSADAVVVSEAFATSRELLRSAEAEAVGLRADADRYVRQREQEAEILVAKARRLLAMAEEKAASIIATARLEAPRVADAAQAVNLDAIEVARASASPAVDIAVATGRAVPTDLDRMLASAIGKAVDKAFPPEP